MSLMRTPHLQARHSRVALAALLSIAAVLAFVGFRTDAAPVPVQAPEHPNILWITSEDNGPHLGAYGDAYAETPNLDGLAARGFRYRTAWSNGPVCGASRTALILGMYPPSNGGEHMRSLVPLPEFIRLYPALLRGAGYYTTNNSKTDYNFAHTETVWDESSNTAHWKNRPAGKPFFAVFNSTVSHESQIRTRPHTWAHDLALAPVPPYMPDVRETREDWAQYYDQMTVMDRFVGARLAELEAAGLADDTIVMYFGDHGSGMPRSKRFPYDSGLRVPLIVHVPERFRHLAPPDAAVPGSVSTRLVSFVDFAPTLLSLAGVAPPSWMQGRAFLGVHTAPAPEYLFGFRGRMDERYDLTRSVRDARYVYLRNFMPHRPHGQHVAYMFETPTTAVWRRMHEAGQLRPEQSAFWIPKAAEELYDLETDPWEVRNLAGSMEHRDVLTRLSGALDAHVRAIRDVGFLPEYELHRGSGVTPYERGHDPARYDLDAVYAMAKQASDVRVPTATVLAGLADANPVVRYWAATGVLVRGAEAVAAAGQVMERLLGDAEPGPRIVAAEALARFGPAAMRPRAIARLLEDANAATHGEYYVALFALYSLNQISDLPADVVAAVQALPDTAPGEEPSLRGRGDYIPRLKQAIAQGVR